MTGTITRAAELTATRQPFALVTVVWRRGPSSGQQGSKAIIHPGGQVEGWLGGACAEPAVVRQAVEAIADGQPRLMMLGQPDRADAHPAADALWVPMSCENEGALEVYVEPVLPPPHVVVIGRSPAATLLCQLAETLGWKATLIDDGGAPDAHPNVTRVETSLDLDRVGVDPATAVVVATQGHYDEQALAAALATTAGYVGLVASPKRATAVFEHLRSEGVPEDAIARVHAPAGIELGHIAHEEISVSILADLVARRALGELRSAVPAAAPALVTDPVCGMSVDPATSHHHADHGGERHWFCAAGCRAAFEADPESFLSKPSST
jgi:xanthine dehydrogenase accessory factor